MSDIETVDPAVQSPEALVPAGDPAAATTVAHVATVADEEADLDAQLEAQAVVIPGDEKLVPLSAVTNLREKLKATKGEAAKATGLQAELDRLRAEQEEARPWIEAAKTIAATRQLQSQDQLQDRPTEPDPALQAELADVARDLDLFTADGKPDLDKAKRIHERTQRVAHQAAQQVVAPVHQHTIEQRASQMYQRAILTTAQDGSKPDPEILKDVFARVGPQLAASVEGARELWVAAMGRSVAAGRLVAPAAKAPVKEIPPPLLTERAGGKDEPHKAPLSDMERRALKQMGMTEKDYLEADTRPWRR